MTKVARRSNNSIRLNRLFAIKRPVAICEFEFQFSVYNITPSSTVYILHVNTDKRISLDAIDRGLLFSVALWWCQRGRKRIKKSMYFDKGKKGSWEIKGTTRKGGLEWDGGVSTYWKFYVRWWKLGIRFGQTWSFQNFEFDEATRFCSF